MGLFDFFKNKAKDTQKGHIIEECIVKKFASAETSDDEDMSEEEKLYKKLSLFLYKDHPYNKRYLRENMILVNQVIGQYWKSRYLMDNEAKCAYEFMSIDEVLQIVTDEDIGRDSLKGRAQGACEIARVHAFPWSCISI